ncbi:hypothetical protein AYO44_16255 [Planctomycetaceae bacterium SCGC AG-212-F19]|nr:hypothetical protein AYO44_16255 [Planctomycetaceae bacterium SCGC AG-212-F19]
MYTLFRLPARLAGLALLALLLPTVTAQQPVPDNKAIVVVRVPANATLAIGDVATTQTGTERSFISPSLTPGKTYIYVLKASWTEGGQTKTTSREVAVRAGQRTEVDLTIPAPAAVPAKEPAVEGKLPAEPKAVKARTFLFTYAVALKDLPADKTTRVWLPVATSNDNQEVEIVDTKALPEGFKIDKEPAYGNSILYAELKGDKDGKANLAITYKVKRREVRGASAAEVPDLARVPRYLEPDKLVPIEGKPLELIKGKAVPMDSMAAAKLFYDVVNKHMRYSKEGTGWGRGDSVWACDSKFGNCSDFHSLFISLARASKIPAKFEIGFPLPPKRGAGEIGGYHCWAFFKPEGKGWVPVDISEANKDPKMTEYYFGNLTEDRVTFTTGRDYDLFPKQEGDTRNFFIYPYVEVDGKEYAADKVKRSFSFKDITN